MKNLLFVILALTLGEISYAQTTVNSLVNLTLSSPNPTIGTQLTNTILTSGSAGTGFNGWGTAIGTGSNLVVGKHIPGCELKTKLIAAGTAYNPGLPSLSFRYKTDSNFTYFSVGVSGSSSRASMGGCLMLDVPTGGNHVWDLWRLNDFGGHFVIMQFVDGTGSSYGVRVHTDIDDGTGQVSATIPLQRGVPYHCSILLDEGGAIGKLACFNTSSPYAQVSTTMTHPFETGRTMQSAYIGNSEVGTSAGNSIYYENMELDTSTNPTFPLGVPTLNTPWAPILSPLRAVDWSNAGAGAIPARATICSTLGVSGQLPTFVQSVTTAQINSALSACPANQTVFLNTGIYDNLTGIQHNKNNITLRGAGADKTTLRFSSNFSGGSSSIGNGTLVNMSANENNFKTNPLNLCNWTVGYNQGGTQITIGGCTAGSIGNLKVGNPIILDQLDDACDAGGIIISDTSLTDGTCTPTSPGIAGPYSREGNGGGSSRSGRQQAQYVKVISCGGVSTVGTACSGTTTTLVIDPPLRMPNWRASQTPQVWYTSNPSSGIGLENLKIDPNGLTGTGVQLKSAQGNWILGVEVLATERAHVQIQMGNHDTIKDSYFFFTKNAATQSYGIEIYGGADNLIENNIFHAIEGPIKFNSASMGDVVFANYMTNLYYTPNTGWATPSISDHTAANAFALSEFNVGKGREGDNFHGPHHLETDHRNWHIGKPAVCQSSGSPYNGTYAAATYGACDNNLHAVNLDSFSRGFNFVNNVLGYTGASFIYQNSGTSSIPDIFNVGFGNGINDDPITTSTLLRWGNWDAVTNAQKFTNSEIPSALTADTQQIFLNAIPSTQSDVPSYFYSSQPNWWPSGKAWPPIGADVTGGNVANVGGHVFTIPAQDCAALIGINANGTNVDQPFNAATCYSAAAGVPGVQLSSTSLSFGNWVFGTTSTTLSTTLTNSGTATLSISSITASGDFAQSNDCTSTLAPSAFCTITASFTPSVAGNRSGSITITTNALSSPNSVSLSGVGTVNRVIGGSHTIGGGRTVN